MVAVKDEIASWVRTYTSELFAYTITRVKDRETAEDLVQNTFLAAVEQQAKYEQLSQPKTWLFAILKNKIADYFRQQYKKSGDYTLKDAVSSLFDEHGRLKAPCSSIQWSTEEELLDNTEFLEALEGCLEGLPSKWSSVVRLKYLDGCDTSKVCKDLDITPSNFWQIMHRAKLQLKSCLENKWFKTFK